MRDRRSYKTGDGPHVLRHRQEIRVDLRYKEFVGYFMQGQIREKAETRRGRGEPPHEPDPVYPAHDP